ncbi:hypothetical protein [Streptomyces sp. NPDC050546]
MDLRGQDAGEALPQGLLVEVREGCKAADVLALVLAGGCRSGDEEDAS